MDILNYFIKGLVVGGTGTFIGGLFSVAVKKPSDRTVSGMLSFTSGIMLSIISFDLMPEADRKSTRLNSSH